MLETIVIGAALSLLACTFVSTSKKTVSPLKLAKLRDEIESGLAPRPTDSVLQRHYDALVEAKLQKMLGHC